MQLPTHFELGVAVGYLSWHVVTAQVMDQQTEEQVAQQGVTVCVLTGLNVDLLFVDHGPLAARFDGTVGEVDFGTIATRPANGTTSLGGDKSFRPINSF